LTYHQTNSSNGNFNKSTAFTRKIKSSTKKSISSTSKSVSWRKRRQNSWKKAKKHQRDIEIATEEQHEIMLLIAKPAAAADEDEEMFEDSTPFGDDMDSRVDSITGEGAETVKNMLKEFRRLQTLLTTSLAAMEAEQLEKKQGEAPPPPAEAEPSAPGTASPAEDRGTKNGPPVREDKSRSPGRDKKSAKGSGKGKLDSEDKENA
jgi:hypothetical protein